jgi:hypothetical protein
MHFQLQRATRAGMQTGQLLRAGNDQNVRSSSSPNTSSQLLAKRFDSFTISNPAHAGPLAAEAPRSTAVTSRLGAASKHPVDRDPSVSSLMIGGSTTKRVSSQIWFTALPRENSWTSSENKEFRGRSSAPLVNRFQRLITGRRRLSFQAGSNVMPQRESTLRMEHPSFPIRFASSTRYGCFIT